MQNPLRIQELDEAEYTAALDKFRQRTVFHSPDWLARITRVYSVHVRYLGGFDGDRLVALLPLLVQRKAGITLAGSPLPQLATPRLYPLLDGEIMIAFLSAMRRWAIDNHLSYLQIAGRPGTKEQADGWKSELRETLIIDLQRDLQSLWNALSKNARYSVRKAVRDGVKLHWRCSTDFVEQTYERFLQQTYGRQGVQQNFPSILYGELCRQLSTKHWRILAASWRGRDVAALWLLLDEHTCYYWDGASALEARQLQANHLLLWAAVRWCRRSSITTYDLIGGEASGRGSSGQGIGHFKKSLGGSPARFPVFVWQRSWMAIALSLYRAYLRVRDRSRT